MDAARGPVAVQNRPGLSSWGFLWPIVRFTSLHQPGPGRAQAGRLGAAGASQRGVVGITDPGVSDPAEHPASNTFAIIAHTGQPNPSNPVKVPQDPDHTFSSLDG
jgi:hypothetical protein